MIGILTYLNLANISSWMSRSVMEPRWNLVPVRSFSWTTSCNKPLLLEFSHSSFSQSQDASDESFT